MDSYAETFAADDLLFALAGFLVHSHFDADREEFARRCHLSDPLFAQDWWKVTADTK